MKKRVIGLLILSTIFVPILLHAQIQITNPLGNDTDTFPKLIAKVIEFIRNIALAVAPIMIIIAGYLFITAMGNPEKISTAKKVVLWTLVGLIVIILAELIVDAFKDAVT